MELIKGISYNLKGLSMGLRTPKLLLLGLLRFLAVLIVTIVSASLIVIYHQDLLNLVWHEPESIWVLWLWHVLSWIIAIILICLSTVISYLVTQILFSIFIMDAMSRMTESILTGKVKQPKDMKILVQFVFLIKQELPRAFFPIIITLLLMAIGWLTPLAPVLTVLFSILAIVFLAWDNTDLTPARQMLPFKERFRFLRNNLLFHVGFGLLFLVPVANILFLSFAPVGATLYYLEKEKEN